MSTFLKILLVLDGIACHIARHDICSYFTKFNNEYLHWYLIFIMGFSL